MLARRTLTGAAIAFVAAAPATAFAQGAFSAGTTGASDPDAGAPAQVADSPPRVVRFAEADYPEAERAAGREASVTVEVTVTVEGRASEVTVAESAGEAFDRAAVAAVQRFEFTPAMQGGQRVAARIRYRYRFRLRAQQPAQTQREPMAVLRGVVRSHDNRPLAGATVTAQLSTTAPLSTTTAADGTFRFALDAVGGYDVAVTSEGLRPYRSRERLY